MKGMPNRQKLIVRPRETAQKYTLQQKNGQAGKTLFRREMNKKGSASKGK